MWASSADMSNSWSKMVLSRTTYFNNGQKVRTCAIYGSKWCSQEASNLNIWASSADMCDLWSKMVLTRITYFDHVGL